MPGFTDVLGLPAAGGAATVVVALVDGLGLDLLRERAGHAPYLRSLRPGVELTAAFPSTTAASLATLGTGSPPGRHGIMGYDVLDVAGDRVVNQLTWPEDLDPRVWQPAPTVLESVAAAGVRVVRVGPVTFDGSGLTDAVLRGGEYVVAASLPDRVEATVAVAREPGPALVYLYWGRLDTIGHERGVGSVRWTVELEHVDAELARLARSVPPGTVVLVTADHGMIDIAPGDRIDAARIPALARGVRHAGGEPRVAYLWPEAGAAEAVTRRWQDTLGEAVRVVSRDEAVARGWFGADPRPQALARAGELIVLAADGVIVVDSDRHKPEGMALVGWHGGLTRAEMAVPLLIDPR